MLCMYITDNNILLYSQFYIASQSGKIIFWKAGNEFRSVEKIFEYDVVRFNSKLNYYHFNYFIFSKF